MHPEEAYIVNAPTEVYKYDDPDQLELPHDRAAFTPTTGASSCARRGRRTDAALVRHRGRRPAGHRLLPRPRGRGLPQPRGRARHPRRRGVRAAVHASRPTSSCTAAAYTDVDGAEADPAGRCGQRAGHPQRGARRARGRTPPSSTSAPTTCSTAKSSAVRGDRPPAPRSTCTGAPSSPARRPCSSVHRAPRLPHRVAVQRDRPQLRETILPPRRPSATSRAVVDDQVGSPTYAGHLAAAVDEALAGTCPPGPYHLAGSGYCSWCELAAEIVDLAGLDVASCRSRPPSSGRPAPRPAFSALATSGPSRAAALGGGRRGRDLTRSAQQEAHSVRRSWSPAAPASSAPTSCATCSPATTTSRS